MDMKKQINICHFIFHDLNSNQIKLEIDKNNDKLFQTIHGNTRRKEKLIIDRD
jgi:hypothetical protein